VNPSPRVLFALLMAVYLVAGWWTTQRLPATGDETEYFLAADALIRGEGLDLDRRFAAIATTSYAPGEPITDAEYLASTAPSFVHLGRYPRHDFGLSILIAPLLALGGRALVVAAIGLAMAGAVAVSVGLAPALGASRRASAAAGAAVGLAAPALTYSGQVFPDAVAPLALAAAVASLWGRAPSPVGGLSIAALPFLHLRYWPLALGLLGLMLWRSRRDRRSLMALVAPLIVTVLALSLLDLATYGVALPHAGFILFFSSGGEQIAVYTRGAEGLLGLFLDRAFGLLPAAPLLATAFAGVGAALREPRSRALLATALPYLVPASLLDWTGGFSPQARYLAPLLPIVVLALALAIDRAPVVLRLLAVPLAVWTAGQSLIYVVLPGLRYDVYSLPPYADRAWLRVVGVAPSEIFPLFGADGATAGLLAAWSGALVFLMGFGWLLSPRHKTPTRLAG
jgi:hypothetical protein